jgi:hypothetical protein
MSRKQTATKRIREKLQRERKEKKANKRLARRQKLKP